MNRKVLIVGGVALGAAAAATLFFYTLLSDQIHGGEEAQTGPVAVAAHALPRGVQLTKDDIEIQTRPLAEIPPGAFRSAVHLEGLYLAQEVAAGRPITASSLPAKGNAGVSSVIPPGMRAISIHVEQYIGVNRLVEVGDRVDVMASNWMRSPGRTDMTIATVLQNVEVLATDRGSKDRNAQIPNVTVLVNADQAGRLTLADQAAELRLALRNPVDEAIIEAEDLRSREVLADSRSSKTVVRTDDGRNRAEPPPPAPSAADDAPLSQDAPAAGGGQRAGLED
jgi:pilus assembly protein CpaB